ncbi:MAG: phosphate starvation-inducible protein PhoH, partial [Alphaproteobacteria bacterium]|nr:phosphate starvation-inducible protein PhoH [Alphaproteobacteria bacterium]
MEHTTHTIEFDDNQRLSALVGAEDQHLRFIESRLGVDISLRGNIISVKGADPEATFAKTVLTYLYAQLPRIKEIKTED